MKNINPFENLVLDKEEQEIENALGRGEYVDDPNFKKNKLMFEEMARRHVEERKSKRITLRVKNKDLINVKAKAEKSGIPYQRLLNVLIHKYSEGELHISI